MVTIGIFGRFGCRRTTALIVASALGGAAAQNAAVDGRTLFQDARKGNCVACHQIPGGIASTGKPNVGPELAEIKKRYPDRVQLRASIWDLSEKLTNTIMPPYGKHRILTEAEIDAVVRYLETL